MGKDKDTQLESQTLEPKFEVVEPNNGIYHTYTNHITADWTLFDIHLRFGELAMQPGFKTPGFSVTRLEERACITMSWAEAKNLRELLTDLISRYEDVNGEIKPPKMP